jgi:hypothetical protein
MDYFEASDLKPENEFLVSQFGGTSSVSHRSAGLFNDHLDLSTHFFELAFWKAVR